MANLDSKTHDRSGGFPSPREDEEALNVQVDWTKEEESKAKRKYVTRPSVSLTSRMPPRWTFTDV